MRVGTGLAGWVAAVRVAAGQVVGWEETPGTARGVAGRGGGRTPLMLLAVATSTRAAALATLIILTK